MLVLWSGGADSTLVLVQALERCLNGVTSESVRTLSINHEAVPNNKQQKWARERIKKSLKRTYPDFESFEITTSGYASVGPEDSEGAWGEHVYGGLSQPILWLCLSSLHLRPGEDLCVGYIHGDDALHQWPVVVQLFNSIQAIRGGTGKLLVPVNRWEKYEVIRELKSKKLFDLTWTCERSSRRFKQCGECAPCLKQAFALHYLEFLGKSG